MYLLLYGYSCCLRSQFLSDMFKKPATLDVYDREIVSLIFFDFLGIEIVGAPFEKSHQCVLDSFGLHFF